MKSIFFAFIAIFSLFNLFFPTNAWANVIEAEGIFYPEPGVSVNQMRRMAVMDAYRYLAEQVDTLYVSASSTVKNMRELDETINSKVDAAIRGAKIISLKRESDGSFHAIARLDITGGSSSIAAAVLPVTNNVEDFPKPKFANLTSAVDYTGLVIDCKSLGIKEAIAPKIKAEDGREIYAYKNIGYEQAVAKGLVEYSKTGEGTRAGSKPLIVVGIAVSDGCDVTVSNEDADKILNANQSGKFLNNCAICFLR